MNADATLPELQAAYISNLLDDGDRLFVGANLQAPRIGALLAQLTHAPNLRLSMGFVQTNLATVSIMEPTRYSTDHRMSRWAEAHVIHDQIFLRPQFCADVFFVGGMQIDQFGNTNLIGIRSPDGSLATRGPGSLGTTTMAHYAKRYYIYSERHDPRIFVKKADYISVFGYGSGGSHREDLGLSQYNDGPLEVITPLGLFDFQTPDRRMRLKCLNPGVTLQQVQERTGFDLELSPSITTTPSASPDAISIIRNRIDVERLLSR